MPATIVTSANDPILLSRARKRPRRKNSALNLSASSHSAQASSKSLKSKLQAHEWLQTSKLTWRNPLFLLLRCRTRRSFDMLLSVRSTKTRHFRLSLEGTISDTFILKWQVTWWNNSKPRHSFRFQVSRPKTTNAMSYICDLVHLSRWSAKPRLWSTICARSSMTFPKPRKNVAMGSLSLPIWKAGRWLQFKQALQGKMVPSKV